MAINRYDNLPEEEYIPVSAPIPLQYLDKLGQTAMTQRDDADKLLGDVNALASGLKYAPGHAEYTQRTTAPYLEEMDDLATRISNGEVTPVEAKRNLYGLKNRFIGDPNVKKIAQSREYYEKNMAPTMSAPGAQGAIYNNPDIMDAQGNFIPNELEYSQLNATYRNDYSSRINEEFDRVVERILPSYGADAYIDTIEDPGTGQKVPVIVQPSRNGQVTRLDQTDFVGAMHGLGNTIFQGGGEWEYLRQFAGGDRANIDQILSDHAQKYFFTQTVAPQAGSVGQLSGSDGEEEDELEYHSITNTPYFEFADMSEDFDTALDVLGVHLDGDLPASTTIVDPPGLLSSLILGLTSEGIEDASTKIAQDWQKAYKNALSPTQKKLVEHVKGIIIEASPDGAFVGEEGEKKLTKDALTYMKENSVFTQSNGVAIAKATPALKRHNEQLFPMVNGKVTLGAGAFGFYINPENGDVFPATGAESFSEHMGDEDITYLQYVGDVTKGSYLTGGYPADMIVSTNASGKQSHFYRLHNSVDLQDPDAHFGAFVDTYQNLKESSTGLINYGLIGPDKVGVAFVTDKEGNINISYDTKNASGGYDSHTMISKPGQDELNMILALYEELYPTQKSRTKGFLGK